MHFSLISMCYCPIIDLDLSHQLSLILLGQSSKKKTERLGLCAGFSGGYFVSGDNRNYLNI